MQFGSSQVSITASLLQQSLEENLHRVALQISGRVSTHRMAFTALATAVSGRCVSMLRSGFWSMEEAVAAMPLLGDLWRAGLLKAPGTGDAARAAVAKALAVLVCGRKEGPGSFLGLSRPSSTSSGSRETMDQRLRRWCRSCELFEDVWISFTSHLHRALSAVFACSKRRTCEAVSKDLLTREGGTSVQEHPFEQLFAWGCLGAAYLRFLALAGAALRGAKASLGGSSRARATKGTAMHRFSAPTKRQNLMLRQATYVNRKQPFTLSHRATPYETI